MLYRIGKVQLLISFQEFDRPNAAHDHVLVGCRCI